MAEGKIKEACLAFGQSQKLEPTVTTLLNLAGCHEKQRLLASAWGEFLEAERMTRSASDATNKQLHGVAKQKATALEPLISKLVINVPEHSNVDGLQLELDGTPIDSVMWNRAMPVDGGAYTVTARAPGANPWSTQVTVGEQTDTKTIDIPDLRNLPRDLKPVPPTPTPTPTPVPTVVAPTPDDRGPAARSKTVPIIVGAGAVALLGAGLGFELWGSSTYDKAKAETMDQARRESLFSSANTKRYTAEGLAVAGVACAGVAVWMFLRHPHEESAATARAHVVPSLNGFAIVGAF
ncbi:MAG: hypothetical protein K8W52_17140 [Deltaproteobacteria bacterium]|nr:hypothetical protein [Deltaproteobacteria bacterium]